MLFRPTNRAPKAKMIWPNIADLGFFEREHQDEADGDEQPGEFIDFSRDDPGGHVVPMLAPMMTPIAWVRTSGPRL
jgi:hypothetical protein